MFLKRKKIEAFIEKIDEEGKLLIQNYKNFMKNSDFLVLAKLIPESFQLNIFGKEKYVFKFSLTSKSSHFFYETNKLKNKDIFIFKNNSSYIVSSSYPRLNPLITFNSLEDAFKYCLTSKFN